MNTKVLAFILAAGTAITLSAGAQASDRSNSAIFCTAIGLSAANQVACTKQLESATSVDARNAVQVKWVARSEIMEDADHFTTPQLATKTPLMPTTSPNFVPNRV